METVFINERKKNEKIKGFNKATSLYFEPLSIGFIMSPIILIQFHSFLNEDNTAHLSRGQDITYGFQHQDPVKWLNALIFSLWILWPSIMLRNINSGTRVLLY